MKRHRLNVNLTLVGPILTASSNQGEPGIDAPLARNAQGRVMLPYSLVKGKVLDGFRLARPTAFRDSVDEGKKSYTIIDRELADWMGAKPDAGSLGPERGRLSFSDFITNTPETKNDEHDGIIERIQLDEDTGTVQKGMFALIEAPYGYGAEVEFKGHIDFIATPEEADSIRQALIQAFDELSSFGAHRTIGFGRKKHFELTWEKGATFTSQGTPQLSGAGNELVLQYELDRPLCVVGVKHTGNHFDSLTHLPGQVLKGAVARLILELNGERNTIIEASKTYHRFPTLCKVFEHLRFGEAKPMEQNQQKRPLVAPLSLVTFQDEHKNTQYHDVAFEKEATLLGKTKVVPAFQPDWKQDICEAVDASFGITTPPLERRVRTSIEAGTGKALDTALFSYGLVQTQGFRWEGVIGLEAVPTEARQTVQKELQELLAAGLPSLGKTRAIAKVHWLPARTTPIKPLGLSKTAGTHVITLQTDCLMTEPHTLKTSNLRTAYDSFWEEVSQGSLQLERFFASQTLHGGFIARRTNQSKYKPFLLTNRGSCFVLKVKHEERATQLLQQWETEPLPAPTWVAQFYGSGWQACPFLPHVGYGEVVIDIDCSQVEATHAA